MSDALDEGSSGATPGAASAYGRILLKVSGEALLGTRSYGVDPAVCIFIADLVEDLV